MPDLAQADALQREEVALGNDAGQPAFGVGDQHMADAVGRHGEHRIVGRCLFFQHEGGRRHGLADRRRLRQICQQDAIEEIGTGEYADRLAVFTGDHQRADALLRHAFKRLAQRRVRG